LACPPQSWPAPQTAWSGSGLPVMHSVWVGMSPPKLTRPANSVVWIPPSCTLFELTCPHKVDPPRKQRGLDPLSCTPFVLSWLAWLTQPRKLSVLLCSSPQLLHPAYTCVGINLFSVFA
jgi:hypothetical protein